MLLIPGLLFLSGKFALLITDPKILNKNQPIHILDESQNVIVSTTMLLYILFFLFHFIQKDRDMQIEKKGQ